MNLNESESVERPLQPDVPIAAVIEHVGGQEASGAGHSELVAWLEDHGVRTAGDLYLMGDLEEITEAPGVGPGSLLITKLQHMVDLYNTTKLREVNLEEEPPLESVAAAQDALDTTFVPLKGRQVSEERAARQKSRNSSRNIKNRMQGGSRLDDDICTVRNHTVRSHRPMSMRSHRSLQSERELDGVKTSRDGGQLGGVSSDLTLAGGEYTTEETERRVLQDEEEVFEVETFSRSLTSCIPEGTDSRHSSFERE